LTGTLIAAVMLSSLALGLTWASVDASARRWCWRCSRYPASASWHSSDRIAGYRPASICAVGNKPFAIGLLMSNLVFRCLAELVSAAFSSRWSRTTRPPVGLLLAISPVVGGAVAPLGELADRLVHAGSL
jgi:hypothetical protein